MGNCPTGSASPRTLKPPYSTTLDQMSYLVQQQLNAAGYTASVIDIQAAMCDALDGYSEWVAVTVANSTAQALAQTVALQLVSDGVAVPLALPSSSSAGSDASAAAGVSPIGGTSPIILIAGAALAAFLLIPGKRRS